MSSFKIEKNDYIKTWAQDVRNSYKIRLKYALVPKGVQTDVRFVDTPYRFQTYQEAREYAKELFPCYSFVVEGSADQPNFNETQFVQRVSSDDIHKIKYYDLYGVKPSYIKTSNPNIYSNKQFNSNNSRSNNSRSNNSRSNVNFSKKEIQKKLEDIEVLRRKLDEKEKELRSL